MLACALPSSLSCLPRATIDHLRVTCAGAIHHNSLSPVVVQQVITAFRIILGEKCGDIGRQKIDDLKANANFFRSECIKVRAAWHQINMRAQDTDFVCAATKF